MRIRQLLTTIIVAAVVAGCAGTSPAAPTASVGPSAVPSSGAASPAASQATPRKLGADFGTFDSPFYTVIEREIASGSSANGLQALPTLNANFDVAKQTTDMKNLITQGVDVMIINPVDTTAIVNALQLASQASIPVVVFDTLPDKGPVYMSVRTNNVEMGATACKSLGGLTAGQGTVVEIQGDLASIAARERSTGFEDCMSAQFPSMKILKVPAFWDPAKASAGLEAILTSQPDLAGIYLHSGGGYLAPTLQVLERKHRLFSAGDPKHIPLVSIDGEPSELDAIRKGYMDSTVSQPADLYGRYSLQYAVKAIDGVTITPGPTDHGSVIVQQPGDILEDSLPATAVTKANVDDPILWGNAAN